MKANELPITNYELPIDLVEKEPLKQFEGTETQKNFDLPFFKKLNFKVILNFIQNMDDQQYDEDTNVEEDQLVIDDGSNPNVSIQ